MGLLEALGLSDEGERLLVRGMQLVLGGLLVFGLVTRRFGLVVNGGASLFVTLLPALFRREYGYSMDLGLVLWITVAVFVHSVGSLGPYGWFPWYDAVTHTVSASVVAGIGYASLRAVEVHSDEMDIPSEFRFVFVVATGVIWEILEFASGVFAELTGSQAVLVVRGIDDIVSDLVFNTVGAVIVATWGTGYFDGLVGFISRRLDDDGDR